MRIASFLPPLLFLALAITACSPSEKPMDARSLVSAMHERYAGVRPGSLTFVQTTVMHRPGAEADTTTWYEAAVPGRLRIDFAPVEAGNGAIYRDGELFILNGGKVVARRDEVNPLLLLLMDVYQFEPSRTIETLDTLGFDLDIIREAEWEGRPVWIVGAAEGDERSMQFWVEKDRLITLRVVQPVGGGTAIFDARVVGHRETGRYFQEDSIMMYVDGRLYQEEYYDSIRAGIDIDPALFDTATAFVTRPYWR